MTRILAGRSDDHARLDVLVVGPVPPPFGGVSMHVDALRHGIDESDMRIGVLNHFRRPLDSYRIVGNLNRNPMQYLLGIHRHKSRVVHYHHGRWSTLIAVGIAAARSKGRRRYIATIHGHGLERLFESRIPFVARLTRWALGAFDEIIAVSDGVATGLQISERQLTVTVLPAYMPRQSSSRVVEPDLDRFIRAKQPVLVVAAYRVTLTTSGADLYGLDLAVRALDRLVARHPTTGLCILISIAPRGRARRYLRRLEADVKRRGHADRLVVRFGLPLSPVFERDVTYVRPSRSDGDAVSVREALAAGVPVVASDAVTRPPGVTTFLSEDVDSLCDVVERVILDPKNGAHGDAPADTGTLSQLISIYRRQLTTSTVR